MKWKELAVNQMLLVSDNKIKEGTFMTVQQKALKAAEVFVTTMKLLESRKEFKPENSVVEMAN